MVSYPCHLSVPHFSWAGLNLEVNQYSVLILSPVTDNEKKDKKQCLLDTPHKVTVNNKRLFIKTQKVREKNMHTHVYKSQRIIKNYKGKLL